MGLTKYHAMKMYTMLN